MLIKNTAYCTKHIVHWLTKVFSSMRCYKDKFSISNPIKFWMRIIFLYCVLHCVNYSITCDKNL